MPSSSTRSTHLEDHLNRLFKAIILRVDYDDLLHTINFLLQAFADLLDIDEDGLIATLETPDLSDHHDDCEVYGQDYDLVRAIKRQVDSQNKSRNVWEAGRAMADVGAALDYYGRYEEATDWSEWGAQLMVMGFEISVEETRSARGDVEMT